ncbi:MAG: hypothetical protein V9E89_19220 [Ilumatobacteraceae bacterium]
MDRDVEAPNVFQVTEEALWDGRPSLGGVWVASPDTKDPERVIMRNPANGKFVIGALFRRERDNPGPKLQISSDAAAALGMLAGAPAKLSITALRREETPEETPASPILDSAETVAGAAPAAAKPAAKAGAIDGGGVETKPLDAPKEEAPAKKKKTRQEGCSRGHCRRGRRRHRGGRSRREARRRACARPNSGPCPRSRGWQVDPDRHLLGRGQCQARGRHPCQGRRPGRGPQRERQGQALLVGDRPRRCRHAEEDQVGGLRRCLPLEVTGASMLHRLRLALILMAAVLAGAPARAFETAGDRGLGL